MSHSHLGQLDQDNLPKHIGIIMDGNGRWAKKRHLPRNLGHREGMNRVNDIVEACCNLNIRYLSLYAFSTENWKRPSDEIDGLMQLLAYYLRTHLTKLHNNNVKLILLGDKSRLPTALQKEIQEAVDKTANNTKMVLNVALNYGGRDEIIYAINGLLKDFSSGKIKSVQVDEEIFAQYLYTKSQPDPDLLIRPGGEKRISNFMIYQLAYTELYFTDCLWPDFDEEKLYEAIFDYQLRQRRYGGLS